jgi:hypothetical protein
MGTDPKDFATNRPGWSSAESIHQLFLILKDDPVPDAVIEAKKGAD